MKLLSICLPTYNRSSLVINQLEFLKNETSKYSDLIDIYVSDNNSDEVHQLKLKEYYQANSFFDLKQQSKNHGLIGNIYQLLDCVNTEYIWYVSDDDILLPSIIETLVKILLNDNKLSFIFFNHQGFKDNPSNIIKKYDLLGYSGKISNGKKCSIDFFNNKYFFFMFITACVYKTNLLKDNFTKKNRKWLIEDPLLFSFICASNGPIYVENNIYILHRFANASWEADYSKVVGWGISRALIDLINFNFSYKEVKEILYNYYKMSLGNYARMLIFSPLKIRYKIITFLGVLNFILLIKSIKFVISRFFLKFLKKVGLNSSFVQHND